jgi:hypothetical protein
MGGQRRRLPYGELASGRSGASHAPINVVNEIKCTPPSISSCKFVHIFSKYIAVIISPFFLKKPLLITNGP